MPAHSLNLPAASRRPLATRLAAGLWAVLFLFTQTAAADVLVVTDSRHPVQAPAGVQVIELDQATRIEVELAAHLPADPQQAAARVRQRLHDGGEALQRRIGHAYQGVADAWGLGIAKIPAVVVDRRYVVYGEPDVPRAVVRINAYRSTQP
ncbi:TIGR03757 family integrating conjugative element protein [Pseudomonas aeruginosa]|nr:TIGR03757 family integrating conjugative element protein [Pseudomonas aeruginosa]